MAQPSARTVLPTDGQAGKPQEGMGIPGLAMGCQDCTCNFKPFHFERRDMGDYDIHIEMKFCGICHSDLHTARSDLGQQAYPVVPGHELAGVAVAVGKSVTKFAIGDHVGVGCFVDACLDCSSCERGCVACPDIPRVDARVARIECSLLEHCLSAATRTTARTASRARTARCPSMGGRTSAPNTVLSEGTPADGDRT